VDNHCYSCNKELHELFPGHITNYQFDNALWIEFHGGYGMFIDPMFDEVPRALLCHECAHELCDKIPWIGNLIRPEESHTHRE